MILKCFCKIIVSIGCKFVIFHSHKPTEAQIRFIRPRPHYTVFKRRYCFVPFSKDSRPHLSFPYRFPPVHTPTLLNLIFFCILPPVFLHYFSRNKLKLSHYAEVLPGLFPNHLGFSGLRPSRFYYHRSAQSWQAS